MHAYKAARRTASECSEGISPTRRPLAVALLLLLNGCATTSTEGHVTTTQTEPTRTELTGTARDAKGGAVIVLDDERVVYVSELDAWPRGVAGRRVRAEGVLVTAARLPRATRDASGAWSQGVSGDSAGETWLDDVRWRIEAAIGAPWSVAIGDGSGNLTTFSQPEESDPIAWVYRPVTPAESSTGTYSGGSPAQGTLTAQQGEALWSVIYTAEQNATTGATRDKGTVQVELTATGQKRSFIVRGGAAKVVEDWLKALRTALPQ